MIKQLLRLPVMRCWENILETGLDYAMERMSKKMIFWRMEEQM